MKATKFTVHAQYNVTWT